MAIAHIAVTASAARQRAAVPQPVVRNQLATRLEEQQLQEIDAEVRAHEHAHVAALGGGVISYQTVLGPDGHSYAVGGGVPVDMEPVPGDPEATIRKAERIIQAAYAPGMPSAADRQVAAEAYQMEIEAQRDLERTREQGSLDGVARSSPLYRGAGASDNGAPQGLSAGRAAIP